MDICPLLGHQVRKWEIEFSGRKKAFWDHLILCAPTLWRKAAIGLCPSSVPAGAHFVYGLGACWLSLARPGVRYSSRGGSRRTTLEVGFTVGEVPQSLTSGGRRFSIGVFLGTWPWREVEPLLPRGARPPPGPDLS